MLRLILLLFQLYFLIVLFDFSVVSLLSLVISGFNCNLLSVGDFDVGILMSDLKTLIVLFQSLVDLLDHGDKVLELDVLFIDVLLLFL